MVSYILIFQYFRNENILSKTCYFCIDYGIIPLTGGDMKYQNNNNSARLKGSGKPALEVSSPVNLFVWPYIKGGEMNGYKAFYKGKSIDVYAESSYKAQLKASEIFKAKKSYQVNVILCEKEGEQVEHKPLF